MVWLWQQLVSRTIFVGQHASASPEQLQDMNVNMSANTDAASAPANTTEIVAGGELAALEQEAWKLANFNLHVDGRFCTVCGTKHLLTEPRAPGVDAFSSLLSDVDCTSIRCKDQIVNGQRSPVPLVIRCDAQTAGDGSSKRADWVAPRRYVAVKYLGGGNFGKVYACLSDGPRSTENPTVYAAKRFTASGLFRSYMDREPHFLRRLRDCCIYRVPRIWDVIENWHGSNIIITDYIPGKTLADVISERSFSDEDVIDFLKQMTIILFQLHFHAKLLHRDIKPDNIMVVPGRSEKKDSHPRNEYFLLDFGIATAPTPGVLTKAGTYVFSPDEQAINGYPVDASDIFSLGLTAVCMLLGKQGDQLPLRADIIAALDTRQPRQPWDVEELTKLSSGLRAVLCKMLQQSHRARYQTAYDLYRELMRRFPDHDSDEGPPYAKPHLRDPLHEVHWKDADPMVRRSMEVVRLTFNSLRDIGAKPEPRFPFQPTRTVSAPASASSIAACRSASGHSNVRAILPPCEQDVMSIIEAQITLPGAPNIYDVPSIVHVIRLALFSFAGAEALYTSVRIGSVTMGSTVITVELELGPRVQEEVVLQQVSRSLHEVGARRVRIFRQLQNSDGSTTRGAEVLVSAMAAHASSPERAIDELGRNSQRWKPAESSPSSHVELDEGQGVQPLYIYFSTGVGDDAALASFDAEDAEKRKGCEKTCKRIEKLISGSSGFTLVHISELASLDAAIPPPLLDSSSSKRSFLGPALALATIKVIASRQGPIIDSFTGLATAEVERNCGILKASELASDSLPSVFACVKELLFMDSSSDRRWQRLVKWHSILKAECKRQRLVPDEISYCACSVYEFRKRLSLGNESIDRNALELASIATSCPSIWLHGAPATPVVFIRVSSKVEVELIESRRLEKKDVIQEENLPGLEEKGPDDSEEKNLDSDDSRPVNVVTLFTTGKFSFQLMPSDYIESWQETIVHEADNLGFNAVVQRVRGFECIAPSTEAVLFSDCVQWKGRVAELVVQESTSDGTDVISLRVDGSLDSSPRFAKPSDVGPVFTVFKSQRLLARALLERAARILTGSEDPTMLGSHFDDLHFLVLTPRYNTLRNQTRNRIVQANLLTADQAEEQVFTYADFKAYVQAYERFKNRALEEPRTLCIIVADECHWGIVKGKAHDMFVNDSGSKKEQEPRKCKRLMDLPNVLILLVSATAANVLTKHSRIPETYKLEQATEWFSSPDLSLDSASASGELPAGSIVRVVSRPSKSKALEVATEAKLGQVYLSPDAIKGLPEIHVVRWTEELKRQDPEARVAAVELRYHRVSEFVQSVTADRLSSRDLQDDPFFGDLLSAYHRTLGRQFSKTERKRYKDMEMLAADYSFSCMFRYYLADGEIEPDMHSPEFNESVERLLKAFTGIFDRKVSTSGKRGGDLDLKVVGQIYLQFLSCTALGSATNGNWMLDEDFAPEELSEAVALKQYLALKLQTFRIQTPTAAGRDGPPYERYLYTQTDFIIKDLVSEPGRMKMVRANDNASGSRFVEILKETRRLCGWSEKFELIADFGNASLESAITRPFQHYVAAHGQVLGREDPLTYENLHGMPCILVLCEKGRMGDTFPRSFNTMDLRCRHVGSTGSMTSFVQEIGRMCRYADDSRDGRPYAIVGKELDKAIRKSITQMAKTIEKNEALGLQREEVPENVLDYLRLSEYDPYVRRGFKRDYRHKVNPRSDFQPAASSYDAPPQKKKDRKDTKVHDRRLLLEAEPQIGKTGTYIFFLRSLAEIIVPTTQRIHPPVNLACQPSGVEGQQQPLVYDLPPEDWQQAGVFADRLEALSRSRTLREYVNDVVRQEGPSECRPEAATKLQLLEKLQSLGGMDDPVHSVLRAESGSNDQERLSRLSALLNWDKRLAIASLDDFRDFKALQQKLREPFQIALQMMRQQQRTACLANAVQADLSVSGAGKSRRCLDSSLLKSIGVPEPCHKQVFITLPQCDGLLPVLVGASTADSNSAPVMKILASGGTKPRLAFVICGRNPIESRLKICRELPVTLIAVVQRSCFDAYWSVWGDTVSILCLPDCLETPISKVAVAASDGGTGFSRLFVQLLSFRMELEWIWMLDDNLITCQEKPLGDAMVELERHTPAASSTGTGARAAVAVVGFSHGRTASGRDADQMCSSPYLYGAFFVNVALTVNRKCYYPPKRHWSEVDFHFLCMEKELRVLRFERLHVILAGSSSICALLPGPSRRAFDMHRWPARSNETSTGYALRTGTDLPAEPQLSRLVLWLVDRVTKGSGLLLGWPRKDEVDENFRKSFEAVLSDSCDLSVTWTGPEFEESRHDMKNKCCGIVVFPRKIRRNVRHDQLQAKFNITDMAFWYSLGGFESSPARLLVAVPSHVWMSDPSQTSQQSIENECQQEKFLKLSGGLRLACIWTSAPVQEDQSLSFPDPQPALNPEHSVWIVLEFEDPSAAAASADPSLLAVDVLDGKAIASGSSAILMEAHDHDQSVALDVSALIQNPPSFVAQLHMGAGQAAFERRFLKNHESNSKIASLGKAEKQAKAQEAWNKLSNIAKCGFDCDVLRPAKAAKTFYQERAGKDNGKPWTELTYKEKKPFNDWSRQDKKRKRTEEEMLREAYHLPAVAAPAPKISKRKSSAGDTAAAGADIERPGKKMKPSKKGKEPATGHGGGGGEAEEEREEGEVDAEGEGRDLEEDEAC